MPTASCRYPVVEDAAVTVSVHIGEGQAGGSVVFLGEVEVAAGPRIESVTLGPGEELAGGTLVVSTTVIDVRAEHDHTSVTVTLAGGRPSPFPVVQASEVRPGGAVNYLTVVRFV